MPFHICYFTDLSQSTLRCSWNKIFISAWKAFWVENWSFVLQWDIFSINNLVENRVIWEPKTFANRGLTVYGTYIYIYMPVFTGKNPSIYPCHPHLPGTPPPPNMRQREHSPSEQLGRVLWELCLLCSFPPSFIYCHPLVNQHLLCSKLYLRLCVATNTFHLQAIIINTFYWSNES